MQRKFYLPLIYRYFLILELKAVYEDKLDQAKEEAGELLARSRQAALEEQEQIIARAKQEATSLQTS